jgi:hypothetical protein
MLDYLRVCWFCSKAAAMEFRTRLLAEGGRTRDDSILTEYTEDRRRFTIDSDIGDYDVKA